jgi:hypothetical protein
MQHNILNSGFYSPKQVKSRVKDSKIEIQVEEKICCSPACIAMGQRIKQIKQIKQIKLL